MNVNGRDVQYQIIITTTCNTIELSFNKLIKFDIHHRQYILYRRSI